MSKKVKHKDKRITHRKKSGRFSRTSLKATLCKCGGVILPEYYAHRGSPFVMPLSSDLCKECRDE